MSVEVVVDSGGRIVIPKRIRDAVGLKTGGKVRLKIVNGTITILPSISPVEFVGEMEGCIKNGNPAVDPIKLKEMWSLEEKLKDSG